MSLQMTDKSGVKSLHCVEGWKSTIILFNKIMFNGDQCMWNTQTSCDTTKVVKKRHIFCVSALHATVNVTHI